MDGIIFGIDIEDYSKDSKTEELLKKRKLLSDFINEAALEYDKFDNKACNEGGDGGFFFIETGNYQVFLNFIFKLRNIFNDKKSIRARGILHVGVYEITNQLLDTEKPTYIGVGVNTGARYLNSNCLRELLKLNENEYFVFGLSKEFYERIFNESFYKSSEYTLYGFQEKNYSSYIYLFTNSDLVSPTTNKILKISNIEINTIFINYLSQSEFVYQKNGTISNLDTFFIFPELLSEGIEANREKVINSETVINNFIKNPNNLIIAGGDQTGKTSLCKEIFNILFNSKEYIPVFIRFASNEKGNLSNKIKDARKHQLTGKDINYLNFITVLIFDDFHLLDDIQQRKIISDASKEKNTYIIAIVDSLYNGSIEKRTIVENFRTYSIKEFGHDKRRELIEKWIEFNCLSNENYCDLDSLSEYVNLTLIKGLIPYTPFYILTVLAARSDFVPLNGEITSKGHCYQALIYISLRKIGIPDGEIGAFLNEGVKKIV